MAVRENESVMESLLDLINQEHEVISKINEINAEISKAKRYNLRTNEYNKILLKNKSKLEEIRNSIKIYLQTKIHIVQHDFDIIYDEDENKQF